ncbi:MAG: branched-chain amino acid ABC transporter substrate-binding protein, partial [Eubacteriales bacterium]|nr:branched-chain amino acid ABC transporter substrate-binding protein [Eubacteriales bacterium]
MRKKAKTVALLTAFIMIAGVFAGCTTYDNFKEAFFGGGSGGDTIKIGVFEPATGEFAEEGELETRGMELANSLYPEVLGKKVELIYADTGSDLNVA